MDTRLKASLNGNATLTDVDIAQWAKSDPYFVVPKVLLLTDGEKPDAESRRRLIAQLAIAVGDREELASVVGDDVLSFGDFYPDAEVQKVSTTSVIDSFLDTFAPADSKETELLSKVLFSTTPDYAAQLAYEERHNPVTVDGPKSEADRLIDRFIDMDRGGEAKPETPAVETPKNDESEKLTNETAPIKTVAQESENTSLTESFARVMIKNGNYRKALQIITELSLNNPEKSIYFADQIRFLKKLIINENN